MPPQVLCSTPHDAGVLDRTGILSASATSLDVDSDLPDDAYRPRTYRSRIFGLATVALMLAVAVIGVLDREHRRTEVARNVVDGVDDVEDSPDVDEVERVPIASSSHPSPSVLHVPGHEAVSVPRPSNAQVVPSAPEVRLTEVKDRPERSPSPSGAPTEVGLPTQDRERVPAEVLRVDRSEPPMPTQLPGADGSDEMLDIPVPASWCREHEQWWATSDGRWGDERDPRRSETIRTSVRTSASVRPGNS
jgi:hypothetical protein